MPEDTGTVTLDPPSTVGYAPEAQVELTALPAEGYQFDHWSGALSGGENPATITMDSHKDICAHFVVVGRCALSVGVDPVGSGTITLEPTQPGDGYTLNEQVTATAAPSEGHKFSHWEGDLEGSANPATLVMDSSKTITAVFDVCYALTVNVDPAEAGGTVEAEPSQSADGYVEGTTVRLVAKAGEGHRFDHWSGALSGSENPATVAMTSAKQVTAHFAESSPFPWWSLVVGLLGLALALVSVLLVWRQVAARA
jgi:hypothetical protein